MGSITIKKSLALAFLACALALLISNVLLMRRISQVRRIDEQLNVSNKLEPGSTVPPLVGYDLSGNKQIYTYGDDPRDTLLLVFSPGCHACDENWPNWTRLIKGLDSKTTRLVIANIASGLPVTTEYVTRHEISGLPVITEVSPESMQAYRMLYTPQTILVGRDGKVRKVQTGSLKEKEFALELECSASGARCAANGAGTVASASQSQFH